MASSCRIPRVEEPRLAGRPAFARRVETSRWRKAAAGARIGLAHVRLERFELLLDLVGWRSGAVLAVEEENGFDDVLVHDPAAVGEGLPDPGSLRSQLAGFDVLLPPPAVGEHDPDEAAADDQADDQEPPVELGVHRPRVQAVGRPYTPP